MRLKSQSARAEHINATVSAKLFDPVTGLFRGVCSRIRLTADGQIRTCLFSTVEHSLRGVFRAGAARSEIVDFIEAVVLKKEPRHYTNDPQFVTPSRSMSFIGG